MNLKSVQLDELFAEVIYQYSTETGLVRQSTAEGFVIRRKNFYGRALMRTHTVDEDMVPWLKVLSVGGYPSGLHKLKTKFTSKQG